MRIVADSQTGWGAHSYDLLHKEDFDGVTRCFERAITVGVDTRAPHFYSVAAADSYRAATARALRLGPAWTYALPPTDTFTLLLRSTDRKILNEPEIEAKLRAHTAASGWALQVKRLQGPLPFVEQVRMYASSSVLLSYHGAQLTNSPFMPRGSVMIELFNCGHWSHTYRKFAEEAGVRYLHAREPTRGCMHDFGKLLGNMDRAVPWEELRPAVCKAMDMVAESKAELKGWALPELTRKGY